MTVSSKIIRIIEERRFVERLIRHFAPRALRALQRPTIGNFLAACAAPRWEVSELLDVFLGESWKLHASRYRQEFNLLTSELAHRHVGKVLPLPVEHRMDEESLFLLYAWIRQQKPKIVVETGVLNGHSTVVLLNAILRNECGQVHSVDIRPDVGALITPVERSRWSLHLLPAHGSRQALHDLLSSLAPIDLFFHDSQHSYEWQLIEYRAAFNALRPGGLLGSDDVDGNYAFLDFAQSVGVIPEVLLDARKVTGFLLCGASESRASLNATFVGTDLVKNS